MSILNKTTECKTFIGLTKFSTRLIPASESFFLFPNTKILKNIIKGLRKNKLNNIAYFKD